MNAGTDFPAPHYQPASNDAIVATGQERQDLRRLACDACRERKIRCDRQHPSCGRCSKIGHACNYSSPKPTASKMDLAQLLMTLHDRMTNAEAQLAMSTPMHSTTSFQLPWGELGLPAPGAASGAAGGGESSMLALAPGHADSQTLVAENQQWLNPPRPVEDANASSYSSSRSPTSSGSSTLQPTPYRQYDANLFPTGASGSPSGEPAIQYPMISTSNAGRYQILRLHTSFFSTLDPFMSMVHYPRFLKELEQEPQTTEIQALSHTIAALGAIAAGDQTCLHEKHYRRARDLLDACERHESGSSLISINTLQACVLLTLYEFKKTNFAPAWMALGRATRLAKMMGLDRAGGSDHFVADRSGPHIPLPLASTPTESEERRRTFWWLYILATFAAIQMGSASEFDEKQLALPLPAVGRLSDGYFDASGGNNMPSLKDVYDRPMGTPLPTLAAMVVIISLYQRSTQHLKKSLGQQMDPDPNSFWDNHWRLEKAVDDCRSRLLPKSLTADDLDDPLSITVRINFAATDIILQEAVFIKAERQYLPPACIEEAMVRCRGAVENIIDALRLSQRLAGNFSEAFGQTSLFLAWPITKAIEGCLRVLSSGSRESAAVPAYLKTLCAFMRDLVDATHIPPALLQEVEDRIASAEPPWKRQKQSRVSSTGA